MRHRVSTSQTGPGHRASHRDAAQSGDGAAPPRAHRDDGAQGEGAASVRRALITIAKRGLAAGDAQRQDAARAPARAARHPGPRRRRASCSTRSRRASQARPGGYTRILRLGYRRGDSAEVAQIELVGSEFDPNADKDAAAKAEAGKPKGVGGRLRAAANRLRGKKADAGDGEAAEGDAPAKKAKPARTKSSVRQVRHPRQGQDDGRTAQGGRELALSFQAISSQLRSSRAQSPGCARKGFLRADSCELKAQITPLPPPPAPVPLSRRR